MNQLRTSFMPHAALRRRNNPWTRPLRFLLLCSLICGSQMLHAQVLTGEIDGAIKDPSGAVVPNATVTVTNADENLVKRTVKSDGQGQFSAPLLSVGAYTITITAPGFKTSTINNIQVHVGQPSAVPVLLSVGDVSQAVDVTAGAATPQLDSAASSTLIESEQVTGLPLSSRDYLQLLYLQPGISAGIPGPDDRGNITTNGQVNTQTFSVNGGGTAGNDYFLDGADTLKRAGQQPVAFPGIDFIQEINLQRANYGAEFGGAGAAFVSVQTKAGSTAFHGGAFGFFRSQILNANTYFNNLADLPRGGQRYADFGYYVSGPVFIPRVTDPNHTKTFFFFGQEYLRSANEVPINITNISTAAQRAGTFSAPVCLTNPCTGLPGNTVTQITSIDPTAQAYLKDIISKLPTPNSPTDPQGVITQSQGTNNETQTLIRIDHQFNDKLSVFFRYLDDPFHLVVPEGFQATSAIPGVATSRMTNGSTNWLGHFTYVFGGSHVLEGGFSTRANWVTSQPIGFLEAANSPDVSIQLPYPSTLGQVPHININGSNFAVTGPYNERNPVTQVFLNNTNTLGRHTVILGINVELQTGGSTAASANAGTFTFSPPAKEATAQTTAFDQAFAYFLLGKVSTFTQAQTDVAGTNHTNIYEGYAQDDYKASSRLTVTGGIRYSYFAAATEADLAGHPELPVQNFDPATYNPANAPTLTTTGVVCTAAPCYGGKLPNPAYNPINGIIIGNVNSPFGSDVQTTPNKTFAPRAGFTYDLRGNGRQALRGGFGVYYFAISNTTFANPSGGTIPPVSPAVLQALQTHDPAPYSQQYSLDFQQQIKSGTVIDIGYYGNHGVHEYGNIDENEAPAGLYATQGILAAGAVSAANTPDLNNIRPYVGYSAITTQSDIFSSSYNSLQTSLRQRLRGGTIITASYTYARSLTNDRTPQNSANLAPEYGNDPTIRTNVFNASFVYPLPLYRAQRGLIGHILGGFVTSGIISYGSGQFLTATTASLDPGGLGLLVGPATGRPDQLSNPNTGAPHSFKEWFNINAYTPNAVAGVTSFPAGQSTPGNGGVANIVAPGYGNWDLSAYRNFILPREGNFELRAEAFNAFNHTNFSTINTTATATSFGNVTGTGQNRELQVSAKVTF
jgi:hypothetical protein